MIKHLVQQHNIFLKYNMTYTIEEIKNKAIPIVKKHSVRSLGLFGSYARNEQK